jgi:hypothetical protein
VRWIEPDANNQELLYKVMMAITSSRTFSSIAFSSATIVRWVSQIDNAV